MEKPKIIVIDYGSQYTKLIVRSLRDLGYRSALLNPAQVDAYVAENETKAVILSGGNSSVYDKDAPRIPKSVLQLNEDGVPVLGICYGMQLLAQHFGGNVMPVDGAKEYGSATISAVGDDNNFLTSFFDGETADVWASHGDSVSDLPSGFSVHAVMPDGVTTTAMSNENKKMYGVQFHPEVKETPNGNNIIESFLAKTECTSDWQSADEIKEIQDVLRDAVGDTGNVVIGFSGGVDSTTLAALAQPVFGDRLHGFCIDHGGLRHGEVEHIKAAADAAGVQLHIEDARDRYLAALDGVTDGEERRGAFRDLYKQLFDEYIASTQAAYILQGTIAPDLIESGSDGESEMIKTHHNVDLGFTATEVSPFSHLFKYEVRALAESFGLPEFIFNRPPFPGPGLFIRIYDGAVTAERLDLVREADRIVTEILQETGDYREIRQLVVALCTARSTGVKGDGRILDYGISIRAVVTEDYMTVKPYEFSYDTIMKMSSAVTAIDGIVRMEINYTTKPPATTEYM